MQELEQYHSETYQEPEEETADAVGFWSNILSTLLSLSWMVTIFFYCCINGSAPSLHIDAGAQIAPYLGGSGLLTILWIINNIYSGRMEKPATPLK
ncbi:MAG: hypothetical protein ACFFD6_05070 [Candidatus Thorarchaeota archaeon]